MSDVRWTLALSTLDTDLALALQIVSTLVLARILMPAQTGIFAATAVFASLASTFRDFGVAKYLIHEAQLDGDTIRAALAVNIAATWLMAVLLMAPAPLAARFYREVGVGRVMRLQVLNLRPIPFGALTMAWFRRQLDFRPIIIANAASSITSFAVAITLVTSVYGYMGRAWSSLAEVAQAVLCAMLQRPAGLPRWPALRGVGRVLNFGRIAGAIYIVGQIGKGAPKMVIDRALSLNAVGMFSRSSGRVEMVRRLVLRATSPVYLPYLARAVREQGTPRQSMLRATGYLTGVGWPFLLCMALGALAANRLMYGDQWMADVPLAQWLCAATAMELLYSPVKKAKLAMRRPRASTHLPFGLKGLRVGPYGLKGTCIGLLAAAPLLAWQPIDEGNCLAVGLTASLLCVGGWLLAMHWTAHSLHDEVPRLLQRVSALTRCAD